MRNRIKLFLPLASAATTTILTPSAYGATITIKGCTANFQIGQLYKNTLDADNIKFKCGQISNVNLILLT
ncbi:MAG: hypothetical protein MJ200_01280 [Mycoplasmoidaceae bacterium]|nr:hypothetical protein [Mycoplasmoidaceae bacterium]